MRNDGPCVNVVPTLAALDMLPLTNVRALPLL
jgi:hypothetical protein